MEIELRKRKCNMSDEELIRKNIKIEPSSGCWNWMASVNKWGYGRLRQGRRERQVHRLSYVTFVGIIPEKTMVLHKCDNPKCCNPDHLFLGTHTDNMRDMVAKNRNAVRRGESATSAKLSWADVECIRNDNGQSTISSLAKQFGVSRRAIGFVLKGETWR